MTETQSLASKMERWLDEIFADPDFRFDDLAIHEVALIVSRRLAEKFQPLDTEEAVWGKGPEGRPDLSVLIAHARAVARALEKGSTGFRAVDPGHLASDDLKLLANYAEKIQALGGRLYVVADDE